MRGGCFSGNTMMHGFFGDTIQGGSCWPGQGGVP
jgi:hypothetical protein